MVRPNDIDRALVPVRDQSSFLRLLSDTLQWPIQSNSVEDLSYTWTEQDLRTAGLSAKVVDSRIFQIANLNPNQPWGVFVIEFTQPDVFLAERGMTGVLRQVLRGLVPSRRKDAGQPSWKREHLLFICTHKYVHFRFAYFKAPSDAGKTAPLAAFGWGPDIPARTACEFNLPALEWPDDPKNADAWVFSWAEAFNVEKVTKRFYTDYASEFEKLRAAIKPLTGEDQKMFTQALMNRLMFLRFIERKGWLTPPGETKSKDYLRLLFTTGGYRGKSFYAGRLTKLFFEALAVEGKQESEAIGKVPFLNGGLFEESDLDKKVDDIPDAAFAPLLGADGLFYRYNFIVQESTPLDIEVAVDPEMLGKVFEELVTGRHESGSYYTPRPVVSFMCREALKGYLANATQVADERIEAFIDKHDVTGIAIKDARKLAEALDAVRAVDPACGSGAYLLGLLHEIVALYRLLYSDKLNADAREVYRIKLDIIEKSLYGVDIDPFATNIAMLRLWLSLTVDSDEPEALPNLDFKIETGNSLTGPDPQMAGLFLQERAQKLAAMKGVYMRAHGNAKQMLRRDVQKAQREIAFELRSLHPGAIDWRVQFCEVFFSQRGGFDIVLANPPYVRQELIKDQKPRLKTVFGALFSGTADLYVFFYLRGLQLLAPGSMLVYISSNKWFRAGYGEKLRAHIARTTTVQTILDFHDLPVFEAIAYPMIFVASKRPPADDHSAILAEPPDLDPPYPDVKEVVATHGHAMPKTALGRDGTWRLISSAKTEQLNEVINRGSTLGTYVNDEVYYGVKTGYNEAFVIDGATRRRLINESPNSRDIIKPLIIGRDVKRWFVKSPDRFLIYAHWKVDIKDYPAVGRHLAQFKAQLSNRPECREGRYRWWCLARYCPECARYFDEPKIVYQIFQVKPCFAMDVEGSCVNNAVYLLPKNDIFLLGVLNSAPFWGEVRRTCSFLQGGYQLMSSYFRQCAIPTASAADQSAIAALAQKCLDARGVGCEAWEREIDERVAALYGL